MAYADNIVKDSAENQYFATVCPRMAIAGADWTLVSGSGDTGVYKTPFANRVRDLARVSVATKTITYFTEEASASLAGDNQWFYDSDAGYLYARGAGGDPITIDIMVAIFELHLSTKECLWYRDPTDDTSETVQWTGCIKNPPSIAQTATLQSFGFYPFDQTELVCLNDKNIFQEILFESSFAKIDVFCWHQCGHLDVDNIRQVLSGMIDGRVSYDPNQIKFQIFDRILDLDQKFTYGGNDEDTFDADSFGDSLTVDPSFVGRPIRTVYGSVFGYVPVNVNYDANAPSTSNNRSWVVGHGQGTDFWDSYSATITGSHSTNGLKVAAADGKYFNVNDRIWIDKTTDQWAKIISISASGGDTILDTDTVLSGTLTGNTVNKSFVRTVYLVDNENTHWYQMEYGRDYTESTFAQNTSGFVLNSSAESNAGAPTFDPTKHDIFIDVAGKQTMPQIGGGDFSVRNGFGAYQRIAMVIYDILRNFGIDEADIDTDSMISLDNHDGSNVELAIPRSASDDFPTYRDLLAGLLQDCFSKLIFNNEGILSITPAKTISSADGEIFQEEMLDYSGELDFSNITGVDTEYFMERQLVPTVAVTHSLADFHTHYRYLKDQAYFNPNRYFQAREHLSFKRTTIDTFKGPFFDTENLIYDEVYGERAGTVSLKIKNQLIERNIGDSAEITRDDLIGYAPSNDNSRKFSITKLEKVDGGIQLTLDDQKGIQ